MPRIRIALVAAHRIIRTPASKHLAGRNRRSCSIRPTQNGRPNTDSEPDSEGGSVRAIIVRIMIGALVAGLAFLASSVPAEAAQRRSPVTSWTDVATAFGPTPLARSTSATAEVSRLSANRTADLPTVLSNATRWVVGILATVATLFLTIGGARYLMAGGDPGEVERAKGALKSAGVGYALALLAPVLLQILRGILGVGG
jgi:hypothetical protein